VEDEKGAGRGLVVAVEDRAMDSVDRLTPAQPAATSQDRQHEGNECSRHAPRDEVLTR
jgi:hypothetical protein